MVATSRVDLRQELRELYTAGRSPALVDVPDLSFLMVDGHGDPNVAQEYREAVSALFSVSYAARFALRRADILDYRVMPLEGLWWVPDMSQFSIADKSDWDWTAMILQPDEVTEEVLAAAKATAAAKRSLPALERLRLERFAEAKAAQVMHRGPYSSEGPTIAGLHAFIAEQGYERTGKHHEIYLSDPSRSAPEKLKTIVRQPVG